VFQTKSGKRPASLRKIIFTHWAEWQRERRESRTADVEDTAHNIKSRPGSPHFWQKEPRWPMPEMRRSDSFPEWEGSPGW